MDVADGIYWGWKEKAMLRNERYGSLHMYTNAGMSRSYSHAVTLSCLCIEVRHDPGLVLLQTNLDWWFKGWAVHGYAVTLHWLHASLLRDEI